MPADQHDFVTVVIHEIAHGLGFVGSMIVDDDRCGENNGCWGYFDPSGFPLVYDRFTRNGDRISLLNFHKFQASWQLYSLPDKFFLMDRWPMRPMLDFPPNYLPRRHGIRVPVIRIWMR